MSPCFVYGGLRTGALPESTRANVITVLHKSGLDPLNGSLYRQLCVKLLWMSYFPTYLDWSIQDSVVLYQGGTHSIYCLLNVMHCLRDTSGSHVVASLNIKKAFDTLTRPYLLCGIEKGSDARRPPTLDFAVLYKTMCTCLKWKSVCNEVADISGH